MSMKTEEMLACLLATLALMACDSERAGFIPSSVVRDSAGVTIVESAVSAWSPETAWRLESEPAVVIGRSGSDPEAQLFGVRGLARLSDGRIAILNQGTREVRVYSPTGDFLYASGGDGDGPGEMRRTLHLARARADTLVAVGHPDVPEVHVYGDEGTIEKILRWSAPRVAVRSVDEERAVAVQREKLADEGLPRFNRLMEIAVRPALLPVFSNLAVDEEGNVWARGFRVDWREASEFTVFDAQGHWLGDVGFPEGLNLDEFAVGPVIGPDWILGVWKDDFDVEEVRLYRLIKP